MHGINRGILLPPGLDEQWLVSVMHDEAAAMRYADVFAEFAAELTVVARRPAHPSAGRPPVGTARHSGALQHSDRGQRSAPVSLVGVAGHADG